MNLKSIVFAVAAVSTLASTAFADELIRFVPEVYPIGVVQQGDVKHRAEGC